MIPSGIEYEADPRQAERLIEGIGFDAGCKSTATPGLKPVIDKLVEDIPLSTSAHALFRALDARANYLAQDLPDLQFAAKEVCRFMSSPTETSEAALGRLGRYLLWHMRCMYTFPFQRAEGVEVYGDTDWSGCPRTRRSASGGCVMIGGHCIIT